MEGAGQATFVSSDTELSPHPQSLTEKQVPLRTPF
jgi:hypothetical protein